MTNWIKKSVIQGMVLITTLMGYSTLLRADVACFVNNPFSISVPLHASIYAGSDLPVGTVLYRTHLETNYGPDFGCDSGSEPWEIKATSIAATEPSGPPFSVTGMPFNGDIYPTNVDGVGIALLVGNNTFTASRPFNITQGAKNGSIHMNSGLRYDIALIKTGNVTSGSQIQGSALPIIKFRGVETPGYTGLPMDLQTLSFTGSVTVTTSTCETQDTTVPLGEYELRGTFKGKGSVTPWKDASIMLTNCPRFIGYYGLHGGQSSLNEAPPSGGGTPNKLLVTLTANTGVINAEQGLIKINESSPSSASGIGIQLGFGDTSSAVPWNLAGAQEITPPADGSQTIRIPLAARYYQVENVVIPGKADGQVMFTINYN
ncbi:TPA: fimbrial protein [Serratia rubidaea]|uniref:fimbrial protein n=1 Tax=unclassified Serratia (in: enterobacteria) TaxID=2647522 RepID=UPI001319EFE4|nr:MULTISPECIES: fimbrial protein [unclassified Serratia (in: enterobacteria)]HDJ1442345.1 fimbrial protein [Serratia rubidaea]CAE1144048.1 Type 1 fimbrial protein [Serratia sp. Tan611]HDJ1450826.1 fimbrial protein [Serratia rubidaea]HDJ1463835.1 fimbrial protein [Serratia rubidaea]HDJ2773836.1 fimbrial protein [Serratia rubidaea]